MILEAKNIKEYPYFTPTKWQTVILKNYGMVDSARIAETLSCSVKIVVREARRLGLERVSFCPVWQERSYITIIKSNWHILPESQICTLLGKDDTWLDSELINNDFLSVKLGNFKPACEEVRYLPLTEGEKKETARIGRILRKHVQPGYAVPFDFAVNPVGGSPESSHKRIVYPYSAPYGDALLHTSDLVSDRDLSFMRDSGINGIWFQGLLSWLSFYPFDGKNSEDYRIRRKNLSAFVHKAGKYGIGVYLYMNEPRAIKEEDLLPEFAYLKGRKEGGLVALCLSFKEVRKYLYESLRDLLMEVPDLAGIMTITSSENLTHCRHVLGSECPRCAGIRPSELAVTINNIMEKAIEDAGVKTELIANLWGWADYCGFSDDDIREGIRKLNKNITVLSVSEFGHHKEGRKQYIIDEYSISHGLPCRETEKNLKYAAKHGHRTMAKVQVNDSWEMASVPYLPVFELVLRNMTALHTLGVDDYLLSWTLGGYPSVIMDMIRSVIVEGHSYKEWLEGIYHEDSGFVEAAVHCFSKAFASYPFSQNLLYFGPMNPGPSNFLYAEPTGLAATMVGFPYDDIDKWIGETEEEFFLKSMKTMIRGFRKGMKLLPVNSSNPYTEEIRRFGGSFLLSAESTLNQYLMVRARDRGEELLPFIRKDAALTRSLFALAGKDARIGFEASNHYLYSQNTFLEKFLNIVSVESACKKK